MAGRIRIAPPPCGPAYTRQREPLETDPPRPGRRSLRRPLPRGEGVLPGAARQGLRAAAPGHRPPLRRDLARGRDRARDARPGAASRVEGRARARPPVGAQPGPRVPEPARPASRKGRLLLRDDGRVERAPHRLAGPLHPVEPVPLAGEQRRAGGGRLRDPARGGHPGAPGQGEDPGAPRPRQRRARPRGEPPRGPDPVRALRHRRALGGHAPPGGVRAAAGLPPRLRRPRPDPDPVAAAGSRLGAHRAVLPADRLARPGPPPDRVRHREPLHRPPAPGRAGEDAPRRGGSRQRPTPTRRWTSSCRRPSPSPTARSS